MTIITFVSIIALFYFSQLHNYNMRKLHPLDCNSISVLALTSCFNTFIIAIFQSALPHLDISPCSYQSNSVGALILLYMAAPFFTAQTVFVQHITYFGDVIKSVKRLVNQMQPVKPYIRGFYCTITQLLYSKVLKPTQQFLLGTFHSNL